MAVTTTGQDIVNGALAKSSKNEPPNFSPAEQIRRVNDRLHGLYELAARVNPGFFAEIANVAESAGTWPRDEEGLSIERIEQNSDGAEVAVVPFDDRQAEPSVLSVYEWGQVFTAVTNPAGTPAGSLDFYQAKRPALITNLSPDTLDPQWREDFNELLQLEVAIEFANKDGRQGEETPALIQDRNGWLARFVSFLEHSTGNLRRRKGNRKTINVETLIPLLAGGGS